MGAPISPQRRFAATSDTSLTAEEVPGRVMFSGVVSVIVEV